MPCRKEDYIFLQQSVTVDSIEVDALVSRIGEALQLHNSHNNSHHGASNLNNNNNGGGGGCGMGLGIGIGGVGVSGGSGCGTGSVTRPTAGIQSSGVGLGTVGGPLKQKHFSCSMRLRNQRGQHQHNNISNSNSRPNVHAHRDSPYPCPFKNVSGTEWDQVTKPQWRKQTRQQRERLVDMEEDDPHRLLQKLLLSGDLIKEAVRRLQFSATDCADFPSTHQQPPHPHPLPPSQLQGQGQCGRVVN